MVAWPASRPGHHVCGLPTMYGFPTMYLGSPPCISINGIRYQVSKYRVIPGTYGTTDNPVLSGVRANPVLSYIRPIDIKMGVAWHIVLLGFS